METNHNPKLTVSEIASVWGTYIENSMSRCFIKQFKQVNEDVDNGKALEIGLTYANAIDEQIRGIFVKENLPLPKGFSDVDVDLAAPRLFSDLFSLRYLKFMSEIQLATYSAAKGLATRKDIRNMYSSFWKNANVLHDLVSDILLEKGVYVRPPSIPYPKSVEFITDKSYLSSMLGKHRPMDSIEISHISRNLENNSFGKTIMLGFSQITKTEKIKDYFVRGKQIANKNEEIFRKNLNDDDIPAPSTWDSTISESTYGPFSEKLLLFQISSLNATGIGDYGASIGATRRKDLVASYIRLMTETAQYAEDGAKLMIENGWLEQPPQAIDRKALINK